jgi:hypothetical protein
MVVLMCHLSTQEAEAEGKISYIPRGKKNKYIKRFIMKNFKHRKLEE